jgi:hypothetical protein
MARRAQDNSDDELREAATDQAPGQRRKRRPQPDASCGEVVVGPDGHAVMVFRRRDPRRFFGGY